MSRSVFMNVIAFGVFFLFARARNCAAAEKCSLTKQLSFDYPLQTVFRRQRSAPGPSCSDVLRDHGDTYVVHFHVRDQHCRERFVENGPMEVQIALSTYYSHLRSNSSWKTLEMNAAIPCDEKSYRWRENRLEVVIPVLLLDKLTAVNESNKVSVWIAFGSPRKSVASIGGVFPPVNAFHVPIVLLSTDTDVSHTKRIHDSLSGDGVDLYCVAMPTTTDSIGRNTCHINLTIDSSALETTAVAVEAENEAESSALPAKRPSCNPGCRGDGQCVDNGVCSCPGGTTGPLCDIPAGDQCVTTELCVTPSTPLGPNYPRHSIADRGTMCTGDPQYPSAVRVALHLELVHGTSCKPVQAERVDFWQANSQGVYCDSCCGSQRTDSDGRVTINTVQPAGVAGCPMALHLRVHNVSSTLHTRLVTQLYFMGDPLRAPQQDHCGLKYRADDPRLSMTCVHWGDLQHFRCRFRVVLDTTA